MGVGEASIAVLVARSTSSWKSRYAQTVKATTANPKTATSAVAARVEIMGARLEP